MSSNPMPKERKVKRVSRVFTVLILIACAFLLFTGNVSVDFNEESMDIRVSYWADGNVRYDGIRSVTYRDDISTGSRTGGLGTPRLQAGHFKNSEFGKYLLYAYSDCKYYVVLETDNTYVVVNGKNEAATKLLYEEILKRLDVE